MTITRKVGICASAVLSMALVGAAGNSAVADDRSDWPRGVAIGSSTIGGNFHVFMTGWGEILRDELDVQSRVEVTGGPVNNVKLVTSKQNEFSPVTMGIAYEGYNGEGWADQEYPDIRVVWPMYKSLLQWWVMPDEDVNSIFDFEGKAISNGPAGSSPNLYGGRVLEMFDINPSRIVTGQNTDVANLMRDGQLVAGAGFSGVPNPTADEMVNTEGAKIIGVPKEQAEEFAERYGLGVDVIPGGVYKNHPDDIDTITLWSAVITHKDMPEDFVYEVTKATFENNDRMLEVHRSAAQSTLENVKNLKGVPFHPGALRYFEEQGVELPDSAYPPEYEKQ
ncbi:TAXI family TRAP transporter solute-binding subunit [Halomonas kalidii]|uniref:TAXI family TRAP transporter solute-binding subunit n=1 Tax=Halomonas kalidii TaxID=3043293 RepID=A0ABT6VR89_9GAMM|nr:TAXI family TRAP transporter solute-binding subunit [Halomonas kalidii]MDI5935286.1 TAXI family TRAP transporter solute-binding subunit [Halomonas kalidii]